MADSKYSSGSTVQPKGCIRPSWKIYWFRSTDPERKYYSHTFYDQYWYFRVIQTIAETMNVPLAELDFKMYPSNEWPMDQLTRYIEDGAVVQVFVNSMLLFCYFLDDNNNNNRFCSYADKLLDSATVTVKTSAVTGLVLSATTVH